MNFLYLSGIALLGILAIALSPILLTAVLFFKIKRSIEMRKKIRTVYNK